MLASNINFMLSLYKSCNVLQRKEKYSILSIDDNHILSSPSPSTNPLDPKQNHAPSPKKVHTRVSILSSECS